ncbi:GerMN domain-containing protein [Agromyces humi]|uniref:GerMN domain-containing protein n=1 Tax=Agromyces humi TaxID=1766800 RepID=UPI001357343B|nr:GerMN domain-containing protein [Agromyces humi]
MRSRLLAAASGALVAALALAGCASIPSSGPVQPGNPVVDEAPNEFDILADPPTKGASQAQILDGFLNAAQSPRENYQIAREYLTDAFADEWDPGAGATVDVLAERDVDVVDPTAMRVEATPAALLLENGQYEEPASRTPIPFDYRFEQVDGEWRISSAPQGLLIDQVEFTQVFRDYTLYFLDPTGRYLVPDVRWYAGRDSAQTTIVQGLLTGAADWLAPGVVSAFPEGVQLEPAAVPVEGGVASVSLAGAAFDDLGTVQRMQAQLDASLIGVRNITRVDLTLNGVDPDVPEPARRPSKSPRVDPRTVVFDGETFGYLAASGESIDPIPGISESVAALLPLGASVGSGAESAAVRSPEGVFLVRAGEETKPLDLRPNLVVPAIDGQGIVWSVPADHPDQLVWFAPDGTTGQVAVPWSGSSIASIEVSRDSTRLLALLADGGRTRFVVAAIERGEDGLPSEQGLGQVVLNLADVTGAPLDVAWLDSSTVASVTGLSDGATRLVVQELGGISRERGGPEAGIQVDGGNSDLRVLTATGDLDVQVGVGWQARAGGIRFVASQLP